MIEKLEHLNNYVYYFQFTLTGYGKDVEPNLPNKYENAVEIGRYTIAELYIILVCIPQFNTGTVAKVDELFCDTPFLKNIFNEKTNKTID